MRIDKATAILGAIAIAGLLASASWMAAVRPGPPHDGSTPTSEAPWDALLAGLPESLRTAVGGPGDFPQASLETALLLAGLDAAASSSPGLPVPAAPPGPAPLASALGSFAAATGANVDDASLRGQAAALGLQPEAEAALARLVLAYTQALGLHAQAVAGVGEEDLALAQAQPEAMQAWLERHPGADGDALLQAIADAGQGIDQDALAAAATLLARTIDAVRPMLAPTTLALPGAAAAGARPDAARAAAEAWAEVPLLMPGVRPLPLQGLGFGPAVAALATALDVQAAPTHVVALPPSLDAAAGAIIEAHAVGIAGGDHLVHAATVLAATQAAAPTLAAWGELLQPPRSAPRPDAGTLLGILAAGELGLAGASSLASAALGTSPVGAQAHPGDLAGALELLGVPATDAAAGASSLPPEAAAALALVLAADARLDAARKHLQDASGAEALKLLDAGSGAALDLLGRPAWTPDEAAFMQAWAQAAHGVPAESLEGMRLAQAQSVQAVAAAGALLAGTGAFPDAAPLPEGAPEVPGPPAPVQVPELPPAPRPGDHVSCPEQSPVSRCSDDVYLELDVSGGILVTGFGSTRIDARLAGGDARIVIDLGGDDVYSIRAGGSDAGLGVPLPGDVIGNGSGVDVGATYEGIDGTHPFPQSSEATLDNAQRPFAVALDAGGSDVYASTAAVVQGSGVGLGATGILLDLEGDDHYRRIRSSSLPGAIAAQGAGLLGGVGVMVDVGGNDTYLAEQAFAQGAGASTPAILPVSTSETDAHHAGGVGLLLDLGAGEDTFATLGGQGFSSGLGTVGLLVDEQGRSRYEVLLRTEPGFQGGRGRTGQLDLVGDFAGGLGGLVDLGGAGDVYSNEALSPTDEPRAILARGAGAQDPDNPQRRDDTAWVDVTRAIGFGLDSSLSDSDADGHSDAAELLSGSDASDPSSTPPAIALGIIEDSRRDSDGDGFNDAAEDLAGTDKDDPGSRPDERGLGPQDEGFLVQASILCPAPDPDAPEAGSDQCSTPCQEGACAALVAVAGSGATRHVRPALVGIDLGGDDSYEAQVAGPLAIANVGGSIHIDVGGNDRYGGPGQSRTQASAVFGTSVLVDFSGNDTYEAGEDSQAFVSDGAAVLLDLAGDDRYGGGASSQAAVLGGGHAILADLGGSDDYRFVTQALVAGGQGSALLLDLRGSDAYHSVGFPALPDGPSAQYPMTLFETQGRLEAPATTAFATAVFIDAGPDSDLYETVVPDGNLENVSQVKDGAGLVHNPRHGYDEQAAASGPVAATFSDGLGGDDADEDGWPDLAELLAGTSPHDGDARPVSFTPQDADTLRADASPDDSAAGPLVASRSLALPGLRIVGAGDDVHSDYVPFLVDLGGDDDYVGKHLGGTVNVGRGLVRGLGGIHLGGIAVLLDVGAGDDAYLPERCAVEVLATDGDLVVRNAGAGSGTVATFEPVSPLNAPAIQTLLTLCPSLGGAVSGVAIAADDGGMNQWQSTTEVRLTVRNPAGDGLADAKAWGVSQGAAFNAGVGMLLAWNGTNEFRARSVAHAIEDDRERTPLADAAALAQGASWGRGVGALLSLGARDDTYLAEVEAVADRKPGSGALHRTLAQGASLGGTALLFDDGGDNRFEATAGSAQASATAGVAPAVASLWSGPGRDVFLGGDRSQAAAWARSGPGASTTNASVASGSATALLVDGGGSDRYEVQGPVAGETRGLMRSTDAATALSQGAALGPGQALSILIDHAGNDVYAAPGRSLVQAAADRGGHATLLDNGGHDAYEAARQGQAFGNGTGPGGAPASATLVDGGGHDAYVLGLFGQGYGSARFVDARGDDRYDYAGSKSPVSGVARPADDNGWAWQANGGHGVDAADGAVPDVLQAGFPGLVLVAARDPDGSRTVPPESAVAGQVHFFARVQPTMDAERVAFLVDGAFAGEGERVATYRGEPADRPTYRFTIDTTRLDDGGIHVQASVIASAGAGGAVLGSPDTASMESAPVDLLVDNPPVLKVTADGASLSPSRNQTVTLDATVSADVAGPEDPPGAKPGANMSVRLVPRAGTPFQVDFGYVPAGPFSLVLDGACAANLTCPDGLYEVIVEATDAAGARTAWPALPLLVDGTPPATGLDFGAVPQDGATLLLNRTWRSGVSDLAVPVAAVDPGLPFASGVAEQTLLAFDGTGALIARTSSFPQERMTLPGVSDGSELILVAAARDALGNEESACQPGERSPCAQAQADGPGARRVRIDFLPPTLADVTLTPPIAAPGQTLRWSALAADAHTGLAAVRLATTGALALQAPLLADGASWSVTTLAPALPIPAESPYNYDVQAVDLAGNNFTESGVGWVDSLAPRVQVVDQYFERDGIRRELGTHRAMAMADLLVEDLAIQDVRAALGGTQAPCTYRGGPQWSCAVFVDDTTPEGTVLLRINATDAAGNSALAEVPMQVASQAPTLSPLQVVTPGLPDRVVLRWSSNVPADAAVEYGPTASLGRMVAPDRTLPLGPDHEVTVTGLQAATTYHFRGISTSGAGKAGETPVLAWTTPSGFALGVTHPARDTVVGGRFPLAIQVQDLVPGAGTVTVAIKAADPTGSRFAPIQLAPPVPLSAGVHVVPIDASSLPDGRYLILLEGQRGLDLRSTPTVVIDIDNTPTLLMPRAPAPNAVVREDTPKLRLIAADPRGGALPDLSRIEVSVNDGPFAPAQAVYGGPSGPGTALVVDLPAPLGDGAHGVRVRVEDPAGNVAVAAWGFTVDRSAPHISLDADVSYLPGPAAAARGSTVRVVVALGDASRVASARIDLSPLGGGVAPLMSLGGADWAATFQVPQNASEGVVLVPVLAKDALGNEGVAGLAPILVDATPPLVVATASHARGLTAVDAQVTLSEPATLQLRSGQSVAGTNASAASHNLTLPGLVPGTDAQVVVVATDLAGNVGTSSLTVTLPEDGTPPSVPGALTASSPSEGRVRLAWEPATDNAGLAHYEVERVGGPTTLVAGNATSWEDALAPAGAEAEYRVRAIDVAGLASAPATTVVTVRADARLENATISPQEGRSTEPFRIEVVYRHPAGRAPEVIELRHGTVRIPLQRLDLDEDCATGCRFGAIAMLPPRSVVQAPPTTSVHVEFDGRTLEAPIASPLVTLGEGVRVGSRDAPAAALPLTLLLFAALALALRRRTLP